MRLFIRIESLGSEFVSVCHSAFGLSDGLIVMRWDLREHLCCRR